MPKRNDPWNDAVAHLLEIDARWRPIIDRVGPCRLRPRRDRFGTLVRAILGQQISSKAAASIDAKVRALAGDPHTHEGLLSVGETGLRSCGVSSQKVGYVLDLADAVGTGRVALDRIGRLSDEDIITHLIAIKGIGRWTAEMFLIFALNRADVLPVHDLGIQAGFRDFFGLEALPKPKDCVPLAEPWRPYRSVAMWYLWRRLDGPKT